MIRILKKSYLYQKIRFSKCWLAAFRPDTYQTLRHESRFYARLFHELKIQGIVFDIGANLGFTTQTFLDAGAEKVIAVEPDKYNIAILKRKFQKTPQVEIIKAAVSRHEGEAKIWLHKRDSALHTVENKWKHAIGDHCYRPTVTVRTITLDGMIREYGAPSYIKVDVEGHELMVLQGLSEPVFLISFEVNLPEYREEAISCIHYMEELSAPYNFKLASGFNWRSRMWKDASQAIRFLSKEERGCYEVFCRLSN